MVEATTTIPYVCPECGSSRLWRDGLRYSRGDGRSIQRWLCRACGYRFSNDTIFSGRKISETSKDFCRHPNTPHIGRKLGSGACLKESEGLQNVDRQILNSHTPHNSDCRVCVADGAMINLATVDTTQQSQQRQAAGATTLDLATIKGKLIEYVFYLKKEAYRPSTIKGYRERMQALINKGGAGPHLLNPEKIKEIIAQQSNWSDGYKATVVYAYTAFLIMHNMAWSPPRYNRPETLPWIPLEEELDTLIRTTGKKMSIFLQGLKETGADPGELDPIKWIDINPQARTITINHPVRGHRPRILDISREFIERLNTLPKVNERIFQGDIFSRRRGFEDQRKVAARKFNNPRLLKIHFTTFRHWKATMEYHKTKDILWVMKMLGHHSLRSTLIYIDLEKATFKETNDEFTVKVADTLDEACKLLEVGFEYITDMDGKKLFRNRK